MCPDASDFRDANGAVLKADHDPVQRWQSLGDAGLHVSICYGPMPQAGGPAFSVIVAAENGQEFDRPYRAESFVHAVEIAEIEAVKRGWIQGGAA